MLERVSRVTLVLASLGLCAGAAQADDFLTKGPLIRVDGRTFDFGQVQQSGQFTHAFQISNGGTADLEIRKIETSCGCTAAIASDSVLAPGEGTELQVTFSSKDFEGAQEKAVTIFSNDPAEPRLELVITADVKPFVRVGDRLLDFTIVHRGETPTLVAYLEADPGLGFAVNQVAGADEYVTWKIVPKREKESDKVLIEATLKPDAPLGRFQKRVQLSLAHPRRNSETLDVRGLIYSYFLVEKPIVTFLPLKPNKTSTRTIEIKSDGTKPYEIVSAETSSKMFGASLEPKGKVTLLHLEFRSPDEPGKYHESVTLKTSDPAEPEMTLKINATVRP